LAITQADLSQTEAAVEAAVKALVDQS